MSSLIQIDFSPDMAGKRAALGILNALAAKGAKDIKMVELPNHQGFRVTGYKPTNKPRSSIILPGR